MSALSDAARDYLRLHNKLGHELAEHHGELPRFVAVLTTRSAYGHRRRGAAETPAGDRSRRASLARVFLQPGDDPINPCRGNLPDLAGADHPDGPPSPVS
jgi:hypothetical protein